MNRSNVPLLLMEQLVMLLVFALAAALCVRAFVLADTRSQQNDARSQALLVAQSVAEEIKALQDVKEGDLQGFDVLSSQWEPDIVTLRQKAFEPRYYGKRWRPAEETAWSYCLQVEKQTSENPLLGRAEITVRDKAGNCLVKLPLAWQEAEGQVEENG